MFWPEEAYLARMKRVVNKTVSILLIYEVCLKSNRTRYTVWAMGEIRIIKLYYHLTYPESILTVILPFCSHCIFVSSHAFLWQVKSWLLHHDNVTAHNAQSIQQFLGEKDLSVMEKPSYSTVLAPSNFFAFPMLNNDWLHVT